MFDGAKGEPCADLPDGVGGWIPLLLEGGVQWWKKRPGAVPEEAG